MLKLTMIALLFPSVASAAQCHIYSTWNFPYRQSCHNNRMLALYIPKHIKELPAPMPKHEVTLNDRLNNLMQSRFVIPDISVPNLIVPLLDEAVREKAMNELKSKLEGTK